MTLTKISTYKLECNGCGNVVFSPENPRFKACANGWRNGSKILMSSKQSQSSIDICEECRKEGIYVNKQNIIIIPEGLDKDE